MSGEKTATFIRCTDGRVGRLDGCFAHCLSTAWRVFLVVQFTEQTSETDRVLKLPLLDLKDQREVIGLPSLSPDQIWVAEGKDGQLVHVKYDIYFI